MKKKFKVNPVFAATEYSQADEVLDVLKSNNIDTTKARYEVEYQENMDGTGENFGPTKFHSFVADGDWVACAALGCTFHIGEIKNPMDMLLRNFDIEDIEWYAEIAPDDEIYVKLSDSAYEKRDQLVSLTNLSTGKIVIDFSDIL